LLEFGNVGIDRDGAPILGAALADHHPPAIAALLYLRRPWVAMLFQPFRNPFLNAAFGILDVTALGGPADDAFKSRADAQIDVQAGIQQIAIA
jgi:hypothetical protein